MRLTLFDSADCLQHSTKAITQFEDMTSKLTYQKCDSCKCVKLNQSLFKSQCGLSRCKQCHTKKYTVSSFSHPTWVDEQGQEQFSVPGALQGLREGEKMLIQQVSPYVPLQHLQKGSFGCKGHVCSFPQTIHSICSVLPRLPTDVSIVNIVKSFSDSDNIPHQLTFRIRKQKVLDALKWLKQYNPEYADITIADGNLEWMDSEEENLPQSLPTLNPQDSQQNEVDPVTYQDEHYDPDPVTVDSPIFGYLFTPNHRHNPQEKDKEVTKSFQNAYDKHSKTTTVDFPYVSDVPINEYDQTQKLFCRAFPWLFPGGVGDINDCSEIRETVDQWMKRLLYYEDGRFASDKFGVFCLKLCHEKKEYRIRGIFCRWVL